MQNTYVEPGGERCGICIGCAWNTALVKGNPMNYQVFSELIERMGLDDEQAGVLLNIQPHYVTKLANGVMPIRKNMQRIVEIASMIPRRKLRAYLAERVK
jgi:hypothetical protein